MTSLQLISQKEKTFKSIGCFNHSTNSYDESTLFPKETTVILTGGKFPLTDYKDLYKHSEKYYIMNNKQVKLIGFCISCVKNKVNKYGTPTILVSEK